MLKPIEETIEEIRNVVSWYESYSHSANIHELMNAQDKLVGHSYFLTEQAAKMKVDYNLAYFQRKIAVSAKEQSIFQSKKGPNNKPISFSSAQSLAINETKDELRIEKSTEALAYKLDLLVKQANKVQQAMQQRISFTKIEMQRNGGGSLDQRSIEG